MDGYVKDLENIAPTNTKKGPTKVFLIPQQRSFNHIYLTFSLSNMIYALLSKNVASRIYAFYAFVGQIRQGARIRGWGDQPNLGNSCILGTFGPAAHPLDQ